VGLKNKDSGIKFTVALWDLKVTPSGDFGNTGVLLKTNISRKFLMCDDRNVI